MGRLTRWFWSPPREGENSAQTIVRVTGNLLRSSVTVIAFIIAAAGTLSSIENTANQTRRMERARQISLISATPNDQPNNGCEQRFPLAIRVVNNSDQTLMQMQVDLAAREPGTSTDIMGYLDRELQWDHIVPPRHILTMCYSTGRTTFNSDLVYSAAVRSNTVSTQPTEEWMLRETLARPSSCGPNDPQGPWCNF